MLTYRFQCFAAIASLRDDDDVAFQLEQRGEGAEHHALIFRDDDADRLLAWPEATHADTLAFSGKVIVSFVPWAASTSTVPPHASMRSRMPRNPLPSGCVLPRPSS